MSCKWSVFYQGRSLYVARRRARCTFSTRCTRVIFDPVSRETGVELCAFGFSTGARTRVSVRSALEACDPANHLGEIADEASAQCGDSVETAPRSVCHVRIID